MNKNVHKAEKSRLVTTLFDKKAKRAPGVAETVEEFKARGGEIQKLEPWETSRPLKTMAEDAVDVD